MVKSITGREQRSQPAARPCCRLSDFRPPQLSYLPPPLTATIVAGPALACTRAACPTMTFESAYTALLSGDSTTAISGNSLTLSSARGVLTFTRLNG